MADLCSPSSPAVVSEPLVVYLLQRFAINKVLGIMMILWGIVVGAIAASQNWATTMALRALQGALESSISPAFLIVTASTWRTEEHSLRALIWGTSNAGMGIITALGMYGIGRRALSHPGGLAPWRAISLCRLTSRTDGRKRGCDIS
jgi:MFS family permease